MTRRMPTAWLCAASIALFALRSPAEEQSAPRLVLAITVDQLRADLPARVLGRVEEGGLRLLYERGVVYADAQYAHAITETAVGHATLFTGAHPSRHGIVANEWRDPESGEEVYSCVDEKSPWLGAPGRAKDGRSPRNLLATTIGDQLRLATQGRGKVFGISIKDRSAILPAGHLGKAFWFGRDTGHFGTTAYYYDELPEWLARWNASDPAKSRSGESWTLLAERSTYAAAEDDRPFEGNVAGLGRTFPHPLGDASTSDYLRRFACTPFADELLGALAEELIEAEGLGADAAPDLLAVSFSMTDAIGHVFGPESLEAEDNLLRLDRTLARLFEFVDARVGLEHTLIVLSADHGVAEPPEQMSALGFDARRLAAQDVVGDELRAALMRRFRVTSDLIRSYAPPYVYLDLEALRRHALDPVQVERAVVALLARVPEVSVAYSMSELGAGAGGDDAIVRRVRNAFHPARSGQVHVVLEPFTIVAPPGLAATHGSPWCYDTHVPIVFAGMGLEARTVARPVGAEDVAPTLAALLRVTRPSAAAGAALEEVVHGVLGR